MTIRNDCVRLGNLVWDDHTEGMREYDRKEKLEEVSTFNSFRDTLVERESLDWSQVVQTDLCDHEHSGAPDFLIQRADDVLGLELTTLTNRDLASTADEREDVLERAEERCLAEGAPACRVTVHWSGYANRIADREKLADELAEVVLAFAPTQEGQQVVSQADIYQAKISHQFGGGGSQLMADLETLQTYVASITIRCFDFHETVRFGPSGAGYFVPTWTNATLSSQLQKKTEKASPANPQGYRAHCDEVWLLIYEIWRRGRAPMGETAYNLDLEKPLNLPFERVYAIKGAGNLERIQ